MNKVENIFICLLGIWIPSFKVDLQSFAQSLLLNYLEFLLNCKSSLYILMSLLLNMCIANIFLQSVAQRFMLFSMYFDVINFNVVQSIKFFLFHLVLFVCNRNLCQP